MIYRIYMDICCLNRPFDNLVQERVWLEANPILLIMRRCQSSGWSLVNSDALEFELEKTPNREKAEQVASLLAIAPTKIVSNEAIEKRAESLMSASFKLYDALHIAFSEAASVDVMLTTDDHLLSKALKLRSTLRVSVENPVIWLMSTTQVEGENHDTN